MLFRYAPRGRLNLYKTNAANEELVIRLAYGREVQGSFQYTDCSLYSKGLAIRWVIPY